MAMWRSAVRGAIIAFAVASAGCSSGPGGPPLPTESSASSDYRLGPGDKIRILVTGLDAMNNDYVIGDSGVISLPFVQSVQASGRTPAQLQQEIQAKLATAQILRNPVVNVESVTLRPFYIMGEVRNPGEYSFRPGTTVESAVAMAGGFTYRAYQSRVTITRAVNGRPVTGSAGREAVVMPGDRILVTERWF
jgi:polysaccharide biosynthesis/export protein